MYSGTVTVGHGSLFQWVIVSWVVCSGSWVVVSVGHWVMGRVQWVTSRRFNGSLGHGSCAVVVVVSMGHCVMGRVQWVTSRCFSWSSCNGWCAMGHGSSFQWVIVSWVVCNGSRVVVSVGRRVMGRVQWVMGRRFNGSLCHGSCAMVVVVSVDYGSSF